MKYYVPFLLLAALSITACSDDSGELIEISSSQSQISSQPTYMIIYRHRYDTSKITFNENAFDAKVVAHTALPNYQYTDEDGSIEQVGVTGIIYFDKEVTAIGDEAFSGCGSVQYFDLPSSIRTIGKKAFYRCGSLQPFVIPDGIVSIGEGAFESCYLPAVTLPKGLTRIEKYTFSSCTALKSVDIPSSVTSIGDYAFAYSSKLTSITCRAVTPPTCGTSCFPSSNKSLIIYVPSGSVQAYRSATYWKNFTIQSL